MEKEFTYCPKCGIALAPRNDEGRRRMVCPACGFVQYINPAPAAGILVREGDSVLLVQRRFEPYRGLWVVPSGFIEYGEDVRDTAVREVREETGLAVEIDSLHAVESCRDDPRGNTVLVLYSGHVVGGELRAGDDAIDVGFFPLLDVPGIAFACQRRILRALQCEARDRG
ncbi:MAG TPA: NUDIX domain-containing protein [Patescibacteria group bacterium]|nr:NUDIX domain-containing protein [Patescibacteria group bacterium]